MIRSSNEKPCQDHMGNNFDSLKSMCDFWQINYETFSRRVKVYNMSIEDALTKPVKTYGGLRCYDHTGKKFRSRTSMCKYWSINRKLYEYRISRGWTQEQALTTPPGK